MPFIVDVMVPVATFHSVAEASMIVIDTLENIVEMATEMTDGTGTSQVLSCALRVLLHCFSKRQSVAVLQHIFAIQRSMVAKVPWDVVDYVFAFDHP